MLHQFNTINEVIDFASSQEECINHLEKLRWENGNVISPFDFRSKVYKCSGNKYRCTNTGKYFNVMTNTLFHNTKIPLQKWFLAIFILETKGSQIFSTELAKQIGVSQKTAWSIIQKINKCYGTQNQKVKFELSLYRVLNKNKIKLN